jgi:glutathione S-transferase
MKLHTSVGPNPRVVKMFLAEKGLAVDLVTVDLRGGENRQAPYNTTVNRAGQTPALELDNGDFVTEITAICEYLEERQPAPPLIGTTAEERAATRMWTRRADLKVCEPMANGFRFAEGLPLFESRMRCLPAGRGAGPQGHRPRRPGMVRRRVQRPLDRGGPLHPGGHPAVRLPGLRRSGRPAAGPGVRQADGLVRPGEGPPERRSQRLAWRQSAARGFDPRCRFH